MALSYSKFTADGVDNVYPLVFPFLDKGHIKGQVDGEEVNLSVDTYYKRVTVTPVPKAGSLVVIRRRTPRDRTYSNFTGGNPFGQVNVNNSFLWQLYISQEIAEGDVSDEFFTSNALDMGGHRIFNLGIPKTDTDAVRVKDLDAAIDNLGCVVGSSISELPPADKVAGRRWTRCSDMKSFIWYVDNNGSQWVEDNPSMGASFETSLVTVADKQELSELNIPRLTHIVTSSDGKTYEVRESNLGLENTPDKVKLPDGRYANRVGGYKPSALGNFKTSSNLNHRCGDFEYRKHSNSSAELLTDLSRFKAYTLDDLQFSGVTVAYADWTKGNDDAGDGLSWATAKASITQALALGTDVVLLRAGQYNRVNRLNSMTVTKDVAIIAVGGTAAVSMLATGTWSKTAGQTNVYQLDYQAGLTNVTSGVYDTKYLTNLAPTAFTPVASIALVEATPNSFFHTATTTYLHTADNRDMTLYPNSLRLVQPVATPTFTFTGNHKLYMEGIEFWGGNGGGTTFVSDGGEYKDSVVYAKNCKFNGNQDGASNGVNIRDIGLAIFEQCEASANRRDGFNYHAWLQGASGVTGLNSHFVEINCRAHNNGLGGSEGNNQGSTSHEDCVGFRISGDYSNHPDGGCIVDIQATKCYLVSCTASNSGIVGMYLAADGFDRGNGVQYAEWWVDGAFMRGNTPEATGSGDLALDGYYSVLHFRDTDTDKPLVTRKFSAHVQAPDEDFN